MLQFLKRATCRHVWIWSERRQAERCHRCRAVRTAARTENPVPMAFADPVFATPVPNTPPSHRLAFRPDHAAAFAGFGGGGLHTPLVVERSADVSATVPVAGAAARDTGVSSPR